MEEGELALKYTIQEYASKLEILEGYLAIILFNIYYIDFMVIQANISNTQKWPFIAV